MNWEPEVLCVFGRGIEKVDGIWQPTAYIERLSDEDCHAGFRTHGITPFDNDTRVVVAGAEINAVACAMLYKKFDDDGATPAVVIFAAGRTAYIANDPDLNLTEGRILCRRFRELAPPGERTEIVFQPGNKNTRDDLVETLKFAKERGFSRIAVISVTVHIPRCQEFMRYVPDEFISAMDVRWFASEPIVLQYFPEEYSYLWEAMISPAYIRTAERERKGIDDLRSGHYKFASWDQNPVKK
jgi:hypothetical protein